MNLPYYTKKETPKEVQILPEEYDWMEEARQISAQCWCDKETSSTEMDVVLAEAFAKRLAAWMQTASRESRNAEFYYSLLEDCADHLGVEAYTADDGSYSQDPILLKIPELVRDVRQIGFASGVSSVNRQKEEMKRIFGRIATIAERASSKLL